ncbi:fatty acid oxidation complex subunit alpha FadB [Natronospirillum operosum]|uniref:enoyl-CoA hydratase n=1 Tax=Natronospirillum operosum TaxID=2759953 RepID=A0A4Z0WGN8_9GAMM|nr:fatty acid oxidation complex subunit alpha FadB [Natronospirillum operosum]TGG95708.1 fatty acid oxidation complex subunit alpha FadB [Natronospirillum operosum]
MIFQGEAIQVERRSDDIAHMVLDLKGESVNKFNQQTLKDLDAALKAIQKEEGLRGLVASSAKDTFVVGADITEFVTLFKAEEEVLIDGLVKTNAIFSALEDLPFPTAVAINGLALGGGFEFCLSCDFRVMSEKAKVGLPEVKLGIFPGFGGTVRLSRLIGADNAIEWICTGSEKRPDAALKDGAVNAVVAHDKVLSAAIDLVNRAAEGEVDYKQRRSIKTSALELNNIESMMSFETAKGYVASQAGPNYPSPVLAVKTIQKHAGMTRDDAIKVEVKNFASVARGPVAQNLVNLFLNDQALKKTAKQWDDKAREIRKAAVLGAGIMGGGIAYQSASKGTPVYMKDINDEGLKAGLDEAAKLLRKQVDRKKIDIEKMANVLNDIRPVLSYGDFANVDIAVEAVVENPKVKHAVLKEVEAALPDHAVIASNTSTISINSLAKAVKDPSRFCGMHFFNPVHRMPLVEVIRGEKSSDEAIATVVSYARKLGKSPIVVNDCPGFYVNRVLFPYFAGFAMLVRDGVDFQKVDKVMEKFGWPMGPAYLLDVVGIDTGVHAQSVMAEGFPDRMQQDFHSAMHLMYEKERYGQKNSKGFYRYELDKKGKPKKLVDEEAIELVNSVSAAPQEMDADDIINRMMIPMCIEVARCLEEDIVASPADADMGLIYGLGFPPFRGGILKYMDDVGMAEIVARADKQADLGNLYKVTDRMREMAKNGDTYYPQA